jgi:tRNA/rRNA methyltransferase
MLCDRELKGRERQRLWKPSLDPPPALENFTVVLVSPKKPHNVGAVARACNCFEVEDLRIVVPACPFTVRSAQNAAMGGQRLLWQASVFEALDDAISDCAYSIAFARWGPGEQSSKPCLQWLGGPRQ